MAEALGGGSGLPESSGCFSLRQQQAVWTELGPLVGGKRRNVRCSLSPKKRSPKAGNCLPFVDPSSLFGPRKVFHTNPDGERAGSSQKADQPIAEISLHPALLHQK